MCRPADFRPSATNRRYRYQPSPPGGQIVLNANFGRYVGEGAVAAVAQQPVDGSLRQVVARGDEHIQVAVAVEIGGGDAVGVAVEGDLGGVPSGICPKASGSRSNVPSGRWR